MVFSYEQEIINVAPKAKTGVSIVSAQGPQSTGSDCTSPSAKGNIGDIGMSPLKSEADAPGVEIIAWYVNQMPDFLLRGQDGQKGDNGGYFRLQTSLQTSVEISHKVDFGGGNGGIGGAGGSGGSSRSGGSGGSSGDRAWCCIPDSRHEGDDG